ncbi:MAG TPA: hypothetical protein DCL86_10365 [Bacteroidales bacterium]|jgi:hypothetical protein|nr:hypothetical protein [Bacteroidales bacterium]
MASTRLFMAGSKLFFDPVFYQSGAVIKSLKYSWIIWFIWFYCIIALQNKNVSDVECGARGHQHVVLQNMVFRV